MNGDDRKLERSDPLDVTQVAQGKRLPQVDAAHVEHPERIGRYRIEKVLGKGGFGLVFLAHDEQLDRLVAIKVPHARLITKPQDAEAYLAEARTVANLDHSSIVPVHDVGSTDLAEWVQDHKTGPLTTVGSRRLLKGGAFFQRAAMVRCGISMVSQANHRADTNTIRPVRTYRLSP